MSVVGDDLQNEKLGEIGDLANARFPDADKTAVKRFFDIVLRGEERW